MERKQKKITMEQITPIIRFSQELIITSNEEWGEAVGCDNRLFLCLEGEGEIVISDTSYPVCRGTVILWKAGLCYRYEPKAGSYLKLIGFNFDFTNQSKDRIFAIRPVKKTVFTPSMLTENIVFTDAIVLNTPLCLQEQLHLKNTFFAIYEEHLSKKKFYIERCSGLLLALFISMVRVYAIPPVAQNKQDVADEMISYIHEHYGEELSNVTLSRVFGYHPGYMGRLLKRATGMSLHQYLLHYRIERAIFYLQSGKSVSETCFLCGFKELAHFSKCFKLKTGYPPSHYCV